MRVGRWGIGWLVAIVLGAVPAAAQDGVLAGIVREQATGRPVPGATVEIHGAGRPPVVVLTDTEGRFRRAVPPATYLIVVGSFATETRRLDGVRVGPGQTVELDIAVAPTTLILNPVVVTASRREEKVLDAPAAISILRERQVAERIAFTPVEHLQEQPGVDAANLGIQRSSMVARGFNDTFSTALLLLTDYRYANIPSNRLNAFYMVPTVDLDIDRIELSLGPGSALYGPNATSGVMHIFTRSPIEQPGTSISLAAGERSVVQGMFRTAHAAGGRFGFKLSGQYFRADDWRWTDPEEEALRAAFPDDPWIGARDYTASRWSGEARADFRPGEDTEWITGAGVNVTLNSIEVNPAGRALAKNYHYRYVQSRFRSGRLFAQAFVNVNDAGDSRFLRTGLPVVDESRLYAAQLQYGIDPAPGRSLVWGVDAQTTDTRTRGTITGRYEGDDRIDEVGGYVHATVQLGRRFEAVGALRVDYHNRLEDAVFSPRAALVFRPGEGHTLRATFNRAFRTPSVLELFLDLPSGRIPITDAIYYDLRAVGVPRGGYTFGRCAGGYRELCMRSPGVAGEIPADATLLWDALIAALAPQLAPLLPNPGAAVSTVLRRLDPAGAATGNPFPIDAVGPRDIDPLRPIVINTIELGYKGLLHGRLLLSGNLYYSMLRDFVGTIAVETPSVFLDPASTAAYVSERLGPLVVAGVLDQATLNALIEGLASVPLGTVTPSQWDAPDILLSYRNFGRVELWGFEVAGQLAASRAVTVSSSVSFTNRNCFDFDGDGRCASAEDRALNAPSIKGALAVRFEDARRGVAADGRVRATGGFPQLSGVFAGDVPGYAVLDATLNYRLAQLPGTTLTLTATNLLNHRHRAMIGGAVLGRLVMLRLRHDF